MGSNGVKSFRDRFAPFAEKMKREGLPEIVVRTFEYYYHQLLEGHTGYIAEADIEPVETLPDAERLPEHLEAVGENNLEYTVLIKLNGGLGTSMGLEKAKSLLKVKDDLTFLDIIARQAVQAGVPLILMNSFNTRRDSLQVLEKYPELQGEIPLDFLQHKVPKVRKDDLAPAEWPANPALEWCPPGHGDLYTALYTSGRLDLLLERGYRYAFVSNADNLGAVLDRRILGYFVENRLPFMMEAADRTEADRKGGHLARRKDGQLILRESAQCPPEDEPHFQNVRRHRYFNTNNLWLDLAALKKVLEERDFILGLPMIRNRKTLDPRDPTSPPVYQLETAMGSAIAVFPGSGAIRVPRSRFAPVKNTNDLLAVRSDAYRLTEDYRIVLDPSRSSGPPIIELDARYYKLIDHFEDRFPYGPPSLIACQKFTVKGDFKFGRGIVVKGKVELVNRETRQVFVENGTVLEGE